MHRNWYVCEFIIISTFDGKIGKIRKTFKTGKFRRAQPRDDKWGYLRCSSPWEQPLIALLRRTPIGVRRRATKSSCRPLVALIISAFSRLASASGCDAEDGYCAIRQTINCRDPFGVQWFHFVTVNLSRKYLQRATGDEQRHLSSLVIVSLAWILIWIRKRAFAPATRNEFRSLSLFRKTFSLNAEVEVWVVDRSSDWTRCRSRITANCETFLRCY